MKRVLLIAGGALLATILIVFSPPSFSYQNSYFHAQGQTSINNFTVNGQNLAAHWQIFNTEEDHGLIWHLEQPVRVVKYGPTVFTYSRLATCDVFKTFIFNRGPNFTVQIKECYTQTGFCDNNQILFDLKNLGYRLEGVALVTNDTQENQSYYMAQFWPLSNNRIIFFEPGFNVTVSILQSNRPITIQPPVNTNQTSAQGQTELQFNFNALTDRDIGFHTQGEIDTATFQVTIEKT